MTATANGPTSRIGSTAAGKPHKWFQVVEFGAWSRDLKTERCIHAKSFGTTTTACGRHALNMRRDWDVAFEPRINDRCEECVDAIVGGILRE